MKDDRTQKVKRLENKLSEICINKNLKMIAGFTVMYDDESGHTIAYAKNVSKKELKSRVDNKDKKIKWPYTGFIIGNILGWNPISPQEIVNLLEKYNYKIENFTEKHSTQFAHKYK